MLSQSRSDRSSSTTLVLLEENPLICSSFVQSTPFSVQLIHSHSLILSLCRKQMEFAKSILEACWKSMRSLNFRKASLYSWFPTWSCIGPTVDKSRRQQKRGTGDGSLSRSVTYFEHLATADFETPVKREICLTDRPEDGTKNRPKPLIKSPLESFKK